VRDGEYINSIVLLVVLLRDSSFCWEVVGTDKKCAISKHMSVVDIDKYHLV
jgi:hypothetical protein